MSIEPEIMIETAGMPLPSGTRITDSVLSIGLTAYTCTHRASDGTDWRMISTHGQGSIRVIAGRHRYTVDVYVTWHETDAPHMPPLTVQCWPYSRKVHGQAIWAVCRALPALVTARIPAGIREPLDAARYVATCWRTDFPNDARLARLDPEINAVLARRKRKGGQL